MGVVRESQSEVTDVRRLINALGHLPHNQRINERPPRRASEALGDRLQVPRSDRLRNLNINTQRMQRRLQTLQLDLFRLTMDAVKRWRTLPRKLLRRSNVRHDRALFDHSMRIVTRAHLNRLHALARVDYKLSFSCIEVQRSASTACFQQRFIHVNKRQKSRDEWPQLFTSRRPAFEQCFVGLVV